MRNRTSDLRITRSNILPLSHRDSVVSVVYFKYLLRFSLVCMISLVFHSLIGWTSQPREIYPASLLVEQMYLWLAKGVVLTLPKHARLSLVAQHTLLFSSPFTLLRFGLMAILWAFSRFNTHSGSKTERNFDGNCERIPFFESKRYLMREYFDHKSPIY